MHQTNLAVLGSPINHSKSPAIHQAAYRALGLDWNYSRHELQAAALGEFLKNCDESWRGLSLTMPLKEEAARLAISLDTNAQKTGAVNTLVNTGGNGGKISWAGFNTDVFGITSAISSKFANSEVDLNKFLIIGSGATATSALVAIATLNSQAKVSIFSRNRATAARLTNLGEKLGIVMGEVFDFAKEVSSVDLVISTLPAHAFDVEIEKLKASELPNLNSHFFDVAYEPWPSEAAQFWLQRERCVISGLEMLLWQALAQVRTFVSGSPDVVLNNEPEIFRCMRNAVTG